MSSVIGAIGDVFEDVAEFIVDDILEPVIEAGAGIIEGIADDPLTFIAMTAATMTGQAWAIPLISGASTAAKGGDITDVLKSAAVAYVGAQAGGYVGKAAGSYAGTAGASTATQAAVSQIAQRGTTAAISAVAYGDDPVKAFATAGVSAGVSAGLAHISKSVGVGEGIFQNN